jgi:hypothetical protein
MPWLNVEAHTFPLKCWKKNEHYQVPETVCQPAEIGIFLGEIT